MNKPILYVLCGIPGSGKSFWSKQFIQNIKAQYVSRDEIRFSIVKESDLYFSREDVVFSVFAHQIADFLRNGEDVIADATHLNKKSRSKLIYGIDRQGVKNYQIIFVYFNTPFEVCCERNAMREGRARVPEQTITNMYKCLVEPKNTEDLRCIGVWKVNE